MPAAFPRCLEQVFKVISGWGRKQFMPGVLIESALASIQPVTAPPEKPGASPPAATASSPPSTTGAAAQPADIGPGAVSERQLATLLPREQVSQDVAPEASTAGAGRDKPEELDKFMAEVFEGLRGGNGGSRLLQLYIATESRTKCHTAKS